MIKLCLRTLSNSTKYLNKFSISHTAVHKVVGSVEEALDGLKSGHKILVGGFGICGIPENSLRYIVTKPEIKDLTLLTCTCGFPNSGTGLVITSGQVSRVQTCFLGGNEVLEHKYIHGEIALELIPQGTLIEQVRAGAMGIPAFYVPAGVDTYVESGGFPVKFKKDSHHEIEEYSQKKERRNFDGRDYILERAIRGDFSIIKAWKADTAGNLIMRKTAKNYNNDMAGASKITVAEVEEIVPEGQLEGNEVQVPGIFVDRVFKGNLFEKLIAKTFYQTDNGIIQKGGNNGIMKQKNDKEQKIREKIARRTAKEIQNGWYVNLGIGIPVLVRSFLTPDVKIVLQGENGILGIGPYPRMNEEDADITNAGFEAISVNPGVSFFQSTVSFGMYRGRHMNATILGGMQVSSKGDIANWVIPKKLVKGMGGAMDLVSSGAKVIVCMEHTDKKGHIKILEKCTLPLTASGCVDMLVTNMAVFSFENGKMILKEIACDHSLEEVIEKTGCKFVIPDKIGTF